MRKARKISVLLVGILYCYCLQAQQALFIPDTLSGSNISLTMHKDSVQFFPGNISYTFSYNNQSFLGPTLILVQGQTQNISVENLIGDTTTTHWHGLHVPPHLDGGPHTPIYPDSTKNHSFTVMDKAATYWYHPHMHMKTGEQTIKGAAGLIIVKDANESSLVLPRRYGVDDFPIIVQCQQYDSSNQVMPLGMEDSTVMVNGTIQPYLNVPSQVIRFRMLNASGERAFNFGFTNNFPFYQIASDGGLLNSSLATTRVRLAPGERAEILLDLSSMNGQSLHLMCYGSELPMGVQGGPTMPMPPGFPSMDSPLNGVDYNILELLVGGQTINPITTIPTTLENNIPYLESSAHITREIRFTADSAMVMDGPFYFNDSTFNMMRIDYTIPLNSIEIWKLKNETMVAHPFHIHDVQFYLLDRNNIAPTPEEAGRKDVIFVLPGDSVRFITKFEDFADTMVPYMYHCHILMHEDDGMMGQFIVHPSAVNIHETEIGKDWVIYPNPFSDRITFDFGKMENENLKLELVDLSGRIIHSQECLMMNHRLDLVIPDVPDGIYFIRFEGKTKSGIYKLLKQN